VSKLSAKGFFCFLSELLLLSTSSYSLATSAYLLDTSAYLLVSY